MYFELKGEYELLKNSDVKAMRASGDNVIRLNFSQINSELIDDGIKQIYKLIK